MLRGYSSELLSAKGANPANAASTTDSRRDVSLKPPTPVSCAILTASPSRPPMPSGSSVAQSLPRQMAASSAISPVRSRCGGIPSPSAEACSSLQVT